MPSGVEHAESIMQDLACPACQYNLRGLRGPIVSCPECGTRVDVAKVMQARWRIPWRKAPGFNRLSWPLAWVVAASCILLPVLCRRWAMDLARGVRLVYLRLTVGESVTLILALIAILAVWAFLMVQTYRREGGHPAVAMAIVAHAAFLAYLLAVVLLLLALCQGIVSVGHFITGRVPLWRPLTAGVGAVLTIAAAWLAGWAAYRGERAIGHWCLRRFLMTHGGMDAAAVEELIRKTVKHEVVRPAGPVALTPALSRYMAIVNPSETESPTSTASPSLTEQHSLSGGSVPISDGPPIASPTARAIDCDVACPVCRYNLRGLRGAMVQCPECGHYCDVPAIMAREWKGPWDRVPGLAKLQQPAVWAVLGWLPSLMCGGVVGAGTSLFGRPTAIFLLSPILVWLIGWSIVIYLAWRAFRRVQCLKLIALSHVVLVGYIAAVLGPALLALGARLLPSSPHVWLSWLGVGLIPVGWAFVRPLRHLERSICEPAIRWYLMGPPPK